MEPTIINTHSRSKDIILSFGAIVALYTSVGALFDVIFTAIDRLYPSIGGYDYYSSSSISLPVALLIVVFPLYILFMWALEKNNKEGGAVVGVRKFFSYITIGLSGGLIAGNLITILYKFIDGQELTTAFLLKVLGLSCIALLVFWYYISDAYGKITPPVGKFSVLLATFFVCGVIFIGFSVLGSPRAQRLVKYDQVKVVDLHGISENINHFVEMNNRLPQNLDEMKTVMKTYYSYNTFSMNDSQTNTPYEYILLNQTSYSLCAIFNADAPLTPVGSYSPYGNYNEALWNTYKKGRYCFINTVVIKP